MMMSGFIHIPKRFRKAIEPECYGVRCPKCGYATIVELHRPGDGLETLRPKAELPKTCPVCGAKVKCKRLPTFLRY